MKNYESYNRCLTWFMALLMTVLAVACGGGGEGRSPILGGGMAHDAIRPTVMVTVAADGATNVATDSTLTAAFSEDMAPATVNATTFTVTGPGTTAIAGTVSYDVATKTATFIPTMPLPNATLITATITTGATDLAGNALASNHVWTFTTAAAPPPPPMVVLAVPADGTIGVATNTKVAVTFNQDMDPATISATTFTLTGPGTTAITGTVSYDVDTMTATFTPTVPATLPSSTVFTATVTTGAKNMAGVALAANYVFTFTTGAAVDATPPTVTKITPHNGDVSICLQSSVTATFSKAMDPATIKKTTFTLKTSGPPLGATLLASVVYDVPGKVATLTPTAPLLANTEYTATITTSVKDLAGNALASAKVWTFTTGAQSCTPPPASSISLGTAARFGNLGGTAGTTNTGILTVINGDVGTTTTTASTITGFHDTAGDIYTQTGSNMGAVTGKIYTCTVSTIGPTSAAVNPTSCTIATQGLFDAQTAYDNLSPASVPGGTDPGAGQLGGLTLAPGVYKAAGGSFMITGSDLVLDAQGDATAVWIFQTASTLTVGGPGAPRSISLINGALAKNVFWHVGTSATINAAGGGTMVGTILASSAVSFSTVGNVAIVNLNGRAVGLNASVTMTNTVVNIPAP